MIWELNVAKNHTYAIDLLNFSYSVTSGNFIVFSAFMPMCSFIIITRVPEHWVQHIFGEMTENNEQLKKKQVSKPVEFSCMRINKWLFNKLTVRCKVKKELPCFLSWVTREMNSAEKCHVSVACPTGLKGYRNIKESVIIYLSFPKELTLVLLPK